MGVEWLNRYVALDKETNYGKEPGIITGFNIGTAGDGYTNGTYTWSIGTKAVPVHGGHGAAGTLTVAGNAWSSFAITDHGQGYDAALDINDLTWATAPSTSGTSAAIAVLLANGFSKGVTYGEADEESMKQTFELLTRQDMSRQVASKAVTNTQYGEGSVSFAVQPDDFMGKIIHSFLPVTECGAADGGNDTGWMKSITITNEGASYPTNSSFALPLRVAHQQKKQKQSLLYRVVKFQQFTSRIPVRDMLPCLLWLLLLSVTMVGLQMPC